MPYFVENDDLRMEMRQSLTDEVYFFPKYNGVNVSVAGTPTWELYDPSGTLLDSGSVTVTSVDDVDRLDITIQGTDIATRDENYSLRITWVGAIAGTPVVRDVVLFDVVAYPLDTSVSLNDLLEERPDVGETLDRMGVALGYTTGDGNGQAQREMAGIFSRRALAELQSLIRNQVLRDQAEETKDFNSFRGEVGLRATRPNLILNRRALNRPLRKLAMMLVYAADMSEPEGPDESAALYRHYKAEADMAWRSIGPLQYDYAEDLLPDTDLTDIGHVVTLRRVQG